MCSWGDVVKVQVGDRQVDVDRCVAPIVKALNDGGVVTAMACCGHGKHEGFILLADGRVLAVLPQSAFKERGYQKVAEMFDRRRQSL